MSVSESLSNFVHSVEAEGAKILAEIEGKVAPVEAEVKTEVAKVEAAAPIVGDKIATDWKALALEAHEFLKTVPERFKGDAVFDSAQAFIKKIEAAV